MTQKTLSFDDLNITLDDLLRETNQSSYGSQQADAEVSLESGSDEEKAFYHEAASIIDTVRSFLRPQFCWHVVSQLPPFEMGKIINRQLRGSIAYAFFVCTAGKEYQEYQDELMATGDMVKVFIADNLGSLIAERCADVMEQNLQSSINKLNWKRTNRFSPGYCGWHVSEQQRLFSLMREHTAVSGSTHTDSTCGVRLTDSSLMIPIKSVSGIIGLGENVRYLDYSCGLCDMKDCYKRRKK